MIIKYDQDLGVAVYEADGSAILNVNVDPGASDVEVDLLALLAWVRKNHPLAWATANPVTSFGGRITLGLRTEECVHGVHLHEPCLACVSGV